MSRAKKPESIAKQPLEEITSELETLSNDQPLAKRPNFRRLVSVGLSFQQSVYI